MSSTCVTEGTPGSSHHDVARQSGESSVCHRLICIQSPSFERCMLGTVRPILVKLGHKYHTTISFQKKKHFSSTLWRGGRDKKRWVTSLTSPYLRQMRRGYTSRFHKSTLCGACRHRLQPPRGPCVGYLTDKVVRLHVLSDVR